MDFGDCTSKGMLVLMWYKEQLIQEFRALRGDEHFQDEMQRLFVNVSLGLRVPQVFWAALTYSAPEKELQGHHAHAI